MSLLRYSAYTESRVQWLGNIPSHWTVCKFRHVFAESAEKIESEVLGVMLSVSGYRGIEIKEYDDENRRRRDDELVGYRIVRSGQLVVNTMWLNYAGLGVSEHEGHVSPAYRSYWIQSTFNKRYVHYMMRCDSFVRGYSKFLTGIRPNSLQMSREDLMAFQVLNPPSDEQSAIAAFLDRETAKIGALIAEQEKLIALLTEKRQAVISHAVTRGLNADAPTKHSGISWLGEIPANWAVKPLRYCIDYQEGPGILAEDFQEDGIPLLRVAGVQGQWASLDGCNYLAPEKVASRWQHFRLERGDLLISASACIGTICEVGEDAAGAVAYTGIIRVRGIAGEMASEFARHFMISKPFLTQIDLLKAGATIQHYGPTHLNQMFALLPPEKEQIEIAAHLQQELNRLDSLTRQARHVIALLKERRSAMITAAVTGQIDVRGAIPQHDVEEEFAA